MSEPTGGSTGEPTGGSTGDAAPLWAGRFSKPPAPEALELGRSLDFDIELLPFDVVASQAHVRALEDAGLLTADEADRLVAALDSIVGKIAEREEIDETIEDVHLLVERTLTDELGELGAKLHAGRSRNDLVVADLRLWCFGAVEAVAEQLQELVALLARRTREGAEQVMPGFTHNRPAQVVTLGYVWAAHAFALLRDLDRLGDWMIRSSVSPLGAGAIATSTLGLDSAKTAERLGLDAPFANALDAVADRDTVIELVATLSIASMHLSRLAADVARWSELGYVALDDAYSTGSSMMPQKRNPDVLELTRGKASRVLGHLVTLSALPAGLSLGYHRDFQEDKEPIFDAVFTVLQVLPALAGTIETLAVDPAAMRADATDDDLYATDVAETLVKAGVAFRDAHRRTGELLRELAEAGRSLGELSEDEWTAFGISDGAALLDPDRSVRARSSAGGPSPASVLAQADAIEAQLPGHR